LARRRSGGLRIAAARGARPKLPCSPSIDVIVAACEPPNTRAGFWFVHQTLDANGDDGVLAVHPTLEVQCSTEIGQRPELPLPASKPTGLRRQETQSGGTTEFERPLVKSGQTQPAHARRRPVLGLFLIDRMRPPNGLTGRANDAAIHDGTWSMVAEGCA
jgi:hypothetical protein